MGAQHQSHHTPAVIPHLMRDLLSGDLGVPRRSRVGAALLLARDDADWSSGNIALIRDFSRDLNQLPAG